MPSSSTIRQYEAGWADFRRACDDNGHNFLPASLDTVRWYLELRSSRLSRSTMRKRIAAIGHFHREAGFAPPKLDESWDSEVEIADAFIQLSNKGPEDMVEILSPNQKELIWQIDSQSLAGARDLTMTLFLTAFDLSREQCASIDIEEVETQQQVVKIRRSANASGTKAGLAGVRSSDKAFDPAIALNRWLEMSGIMAGPLFRSFDRHGNTRGRITGRTVFDVVRKYAKLAGLDNFSPMNLRRVHSKR